MGCGSQPSPHPTYKVPDWYDTKDWDGRGRPLFFLGSVFNLSTLGKYLYRWTRYCYPAKQVSWPEIISQGIWEDFIKLLMYSEAMEHCLRTGPGGACGTAGMIRELTREGKDLSEQIQETLRICESEIQKRRKQEGECARTSLTPSDQGKLLVKTFLGEKGVFAGEACQTANILQNLRVWREKVEREVKAIRILVAAASSAT